MKYLIFLFIVVFFRSICLAQTKACANPTIDTLTQQTVYNRVDQMPIPEGGMQSLYKDIAEVEYPAKLREETLSKILVAFIVNKNGEAYGERIVKTWDNKMAREILSVIKKHKWKAGSCNENKVSVLQIFVLNPPKLG